MMLRGNDNRNSANHPLAFAIDSSDVRPHLGGQPLPELGQLPVIMGVI